MYVLMCIVGKAAQKIPTDGANINITWSPDGSTIAVGNKVLTIGIPWHGNSSWEQVDVLSFIDTKTYKIAHKKECDFEVQRPWPSPHNRSQSLTIAGE